MQRENPFDCPTARANASYSAARDGRILIVEESDEDRARANQEAFEQLQDFIVRRPYPCVGAQAAFNKEGCRFGTYARLGDADAALGLARDLFRFVKELESAADTFMSYIAVVDGSAGLKEHVFERLLWKHLAHLHVLDRRHHEWADTVSSDPEDATFSFSFAGRAFYVVGMHPNSSRLARRFPRPTLVFNPRSQFDRLRERGAYPTMKRLIRARDEALQGTVNPMLQDFGDASEARQYSGRAVEDDWTCPFHDAVSEAASST